jgi:hypothetical protein
MKLLIVTVFAMSLFGATAASADILGAHVGPVHVGLGVHGDRDRDRDHPRHCEWRRHHHRVCW